MNLNTFFSFDPATNKVASRESTHQEFKVGYEFAALTKYAKTMAAFANTGGGAITFGISNNPRFVVGVPAGSAPDEAVITDILRKNFDPEIRFSIIEHQIGSMYLFSIVVQEASTKPVICKKNCTELVTKSKNGKDVHDNVEILREGDIYRRYGGKTDRIRFTDLHDIFQERDRRIFASLIEMVDGIRKIGVERVGIADIAAAGGDGGISKIYVSKEAAKNLRLIDKGRFVETEDAGQTAYFVAGTVQLHEAHEVPVDDHDRIKAGKVVAILQKEAQKMFFPGFVLHPMHLSNFAKAAGFRLGKAEHEHNNRYCKWDDQAGQWFYRQAFVTLLREQCAAAPRDTLAKMSGRKNLDKFDKHHTAKRVV
ncbi:MAG: helix-turn-helix domain-containing protein [Actinomycetota bacterium]